MERESGLSKNEEIVRSLSEGKGEVQQRENPLTSRELERLKLAALGLSYKEIASEHSMKHHSVQYAFYRMYRKLGVNNEYGAVVLGINSSWIEPVECVGDQDLSLFERLTPREVDIVKLNAFGKTNQEIADELSISKKTVENHNNKIYSDFEIAIGKMGYKKTRLAVLYHAYLKGLENSDPS
jgi:DNA-binding NarL/FixJ family response regulator